MRLEISKSFAKKLAGRIEKYEFEVGVLRDKTRFQDTSEIREYAGGPVLKQSRQKSDQTNADVLVSNMKRLNIDLLRRPFEEDSSEINRFTKAFLQMATGGKVALKRVENLLQAVVRNPILRQEYGQNSTSTADLKGFNRHLFATSQMFKSIIAKATKR